ncbi:pilus (MSHA type) biogenesis protein MshL [Halomonadaceae bacterium KBTZ08]
MRERFLPFLTPVILGLLMAGCAGNPLLQTEQATSTETTKRIEQELAEDDAGQDEPEQGQAPEAVTGALMPDFGGGGASGASEQERFNVNAQGLAAPAFFQSLVDGTSYNVVVDPAVEGSITLDLTQVTLQEVMDVVSDLYGYEVSREGRIYRVRPAGLRTRIFQVDYLDIKRSGNSETQVRSGQVTDGGNSDSGSGDSGNGNNEGAVVGTRITTTSESHFWQDLSDSLELMVAKDKGQRVITNPGTGVVVVHARPDALKTVEEYLRRMQLISKRQVILEARILEVELNEQYQQGINWNAVDEVGSGTIEGSLSSIGASTQGGGVFSTALDVQGFDSLIQLLGSQGNVQVLSSPRISTVNNEKAVIKVGSDEFFVTDLDFEDDTGGATGTSNSRSTSVDLTPFFSGISLDVTPQISDQDVVTLHVHPSVSEVEDQEKLITIGDRDVTLPLAFSTVRETDSVVRARSGQIVVIGGLIQDRTEETRSAVPFFSDIPVLGELFTQRDYDASKSELVILLKPMIANTGRYGKDVEDSRQRIRDLRRIMESTESPRPKPAPGAERER